MTNGDHEGPMFLSHAPMNNELFFLPPSNTAFYVLKMLPEVPEYTEVRRDMMTLL